MTARSMFGDPLRAVVGVDDAATLFEAAGTLAQAEIGALLVVRGSRPVGVLSERDLVRAVADNADLAWTQVRDYMTPAPVWVTPRSSPEAAAAVMCRHGIRHLAVVEDGEVVGMVSARDVLGALAGRAGGHTHTSHAGRGTDGGGEP